MPEIKAALDCHRCGCSWTIRILLPVEPPETFTIHECCPWCGWFGSKPMRDLLPAGPTTVIIDANPFAEEENDGE